MDGGFSYLIHEQSYTTDCSLCARYSPESFTLVSAVDIGWSMTQRPSAARGSIPIELLLLNRSHSLKVTKSLT